MSDQSALSPPSRATIPSAEEQRLRAALVHSMERFRDIADIMDRNPSRDMPVSSGFMRASAMRIERVLTDDGWHYSDDIHAQAIEARRGETAKTGSTAKPRKRGPKGAPKTPSESTHHDH